MGMSHRQPLQSQLGQISYPIHQQYYPRRMLLPHRYGQRNNQRRHGQRFQRRDVMEISSSSSSDEEKGDRLSPSNSFSFDSDDFVKQKYKIYADIPINDHISEWLPISQLLKQLNGKHISNDSLSEIVSVLGFDTKEFITFLYQNKKMSKEELIKIHDILIKDMNENSIYECNNSESFFSILSTSSITNICSFLTKSEIASFKQTSIQIAIECLN